MRFSDFNVWTLDGDDLIVYNTLTGALLTFNKRTANRVLVAMQRGNITRVPKCYIPNLTRDGVIVEDNYDELSVVKARNLLGRTQNELILSVMLTMSCNFKCRYCFQSRKSKLNTMSHKTEQRVVSLVKREAKKKDRISVDWYGGEPLLRFNQLVRMNNAFARECEKCDTEYLVSVTTNGYLFTPEVVKYLSGFNVTHLQITLDGPPETHDFSRPFANGNGTFATILANIRRAVEAGVPVIVRVNVWKLNIGQVSKLYDILEENGLRNKVNVIIKPVLSSKANPCQASCLPVNEVAQLSLGIYRDAATKGWVVLPELSHLQGHEFCIVDSVGQFIIDPGGRLYKCGECFEKSESVGCLGQNGELRLDELSWTRWIGKDPLSFSECRACKLLPICMGGCSMKRFWRQEESPCIEFKYCLDGLLKTMVASEANITNERRKS